MTAKNDSALLEIIGRLFVEAEQLKANNEEAIEAARKEVQDQVQEQKNKWNVRMDEATARYAESQEKLDDALEEVRQKKRELEETTGLLRSNHAALAEVKEENAKLKEERKRRAAEERKPQKSSKVITSAPSKNIRVLIDRAIQTLYEEPEKAARSLRAALKEIDKAKEE